MRSLATALTTIRRTPYQALSTILLVSVTFLTAYAVSFLLIGAQLILQHFESRPQVIAFFELEAEEQSITTLADKLKQNPSVTEVTIVTQEQALKDYTELNQDSPLLLELVTADILPASLEVSATSLAALSGITDELKAAPEVEDVVYQEDLVNQLETWTNSIRVAGSIAVGVLAFISFLNITIVIAMKAASKKYAISVMRLVGASGWYVKKPFLVEGMIYGIFGSVIGWAVVQSAILYITPELNEFLAGIITFPIPLDFVLLQLTAGIAAGVFLGGFAGLVAVNRFVKRA